MLRDVATRWNSTFDMLTFAILYRKPIRAVTRNSNLAIYQLTAQEWDYAAELKRALQVSTIDFMTIPLVLIHTLWPVSIDF